MFNNSDLKVYLDLLEHITSIDSPYDNLKGIENIISVVANKAENMGLHTNKMTYSSNFGDCLVISNHKEQEHIDLLMLAHIDTSYPIGSVNQHPFTLNDQQAHGLGVANNKGGALAGLFALKHIDSNHINAALILNSNEEYGSKISSALIKELSSKSTYVLSLESTTDQNDFIDKRFGMANYKLIFKGSPATIYNFKDGVSPIYELAKLIKSLEVLNNNPTGSLINPIILAPMNQDINSIQDMLEVGLQIRFAENNFFTKVENRIEQNVSSLNSKITFEIEKLSYYPCMTQSFKQRELKKLVESAALKNNIVAQWNSSFGGSDACFASQVESCITLDGFGPVGGNLNTPEEYLDIKSVEPTCNMLIDITNEVIKQKQAKIKYEQHKVLSEQRKKENEENN